jgi:RNA ligase (TIGR02306 family)
MSSLIVGVTKISKIRPHPQADRLEIAEVLGWQVVVKKGQFKDGDRIVFVPPDTVLPKDVSDRFGVTNYLANGRVKCARLRGEPSYGLVVPPDDPAWPEGMDVTQHYKATKYFPPIRTGVEDEMEDHPLFHKYTDMEDLRNFPDAFRPGEEVVVTEKCDGTNQRTGLVEGQWMAGSHDLRRKPPDPQSVPIPGGPRELRVSLYWFPISEHCPFAEKTKRLLVGIRDARNAKSVILFGEVFGPKIQDFSYGRTQIDFLAFDLTVEGKYLEFDEFKSVCEEYGVPMVPVLYRGPFDLGVIRKLADEDSTIGGGRYREGLVVRPTRERTSNLRGAVQRLVLKFKGDKYLTEAHTDYKDR